MLKCPDLREFKRIVWEHNAIVTHRDWDGICSAGLLQAFLEDTCGYETREQSLLFSHPRLLIQKHMVIKLAQKKGKDVKVGVTIPLYLRRCFVLDLPHIPEARLWVDHHDAAEPNPKSIEKCPIYCYDKTAASAVQLLTRLLRTRFEFNVPQELINFTNKFDAGAYGKKRRLENQEKVPMINQLCYITEAFHGKKDYALTHHVTDLVKEHYQNLEEIEDPIIQERYEEVKVRRERGRDLIRKSEFYHGLLLVDATEVEHKYLVIYPDVSPIFQKEIRPQLGLSEDALFASILIRESGSVRIGLRWRQNPRLVALKHSGKLDIRPLARQFGGEGHYNVVGFMIDLKKKEDEFTKIKEAWDETVRGWTEKKNDRNYR